MASGLGHEAELLEGSEETKCAMDVAIQVKTDLEVVEITTEKITMVAEIGTKRGMPLSNFCTAFYA